MSRSAFVVVISNARAVKPRAYREFDIFLLYVATSEAPKSNFSPINIRGLSPKTRRRLIRSRKPLPGKPICKYALSYRNNAYVSLKNDRNSGTVCCGDAFEQARNVTAHGGSSVPVSLSPTDSIDFQSETWKQRGTNNLAIKAADEILNEAGNKRAMEFSNEA